MGQNQNKATEPEVKLFLQNFLEAKTTRNRQNNCLHDGAGCNCSKWQWKNTFLTKIKSRYFPFAWQYWCTSQVSTLEPDFSSSLHTLTDILTHLCEVFHLFLHPSHPLRAFFTADILTCHGRKTTSGTNAINYVSSALCLSVSDSSSEQACRVQGPSTAAIINAVRHTCVVSHSVIRQQVETPGQVCRAFLLCSYKTKLHVFTL